MTGLDIIAWVVLMVVGMAMLSGQIARDRRHPWAEAVSVAGWVTLFFGFVFWPLAVVWAYVDVPARNDEVPR